MEKPETWNRKSVISELSQGRDVANELKRQIYPSTTSKEACEFLLDKIFSSYDNALALLNCMDVLEMDPSEVSNQDSMDHQTHKKSITKKRKGVPRYSDKVLVRSGTEGQIDDGYNWRKYGQKPIFSANHPRSYYRCTHRHTQGCLATKQVQRTDQDPLISEVLYRGKHTCVQETTTRKPNKEHVDVKIEVENQNQKPPTGLEKLDTQFSLEPRDFVPFMSPSTSESYLTQSNSEVYGFMMSADLQTDFTEIVSNRPTSRSLFGDLDFTNDYVDFDTCFLDAAEYF